MSDLTGQMLGAYKVLERIGTGGMASVYRAYQASMDRFVAVKVLREEMYQEPSVRERFQREVRTIARLEHPYILPVYDFGEDRGVPYLVMSCAISRRVFSGHGAACFCTHATDSAEGCC